MAYSPSGTDPSPSVDPSDLADTASAPTPAESGGLLRKATAGLARKDGRSPGTPMWMPLLTSFATTCLLLLPIEYRMAVETALLALFPRHF